MGFARFSNRLVVATYSIRGALISEPGVSELWEENALYAGCTGFSSASLQRAGGTSGVSLRAKIHAVCCVYWRPHGRGCARLGRWFEPCARRVALQHFCIERSRMLVRVKKYVPEDIAAR